MKTVAVAVLAAGVLALAGGAQASVGVLDQVNPDGLAGFNAIDHHWQQEVTAGVDGKLAGITLKGDGTARVRIAQGGAFNGGPFLFDQVVDMTGTYLAGLFIDTRAANILLSAGDVFVIDLTEGTKGYGGSSTPYVGGDLWVADGGWPAPTNFTDLGGYSLAFETYMGAVPEPGTWALMIAGFGLAGAGLRRRAVAAA